MMCINTYNMSDSAIYKSKYKIEDVGLGQSIVSWAKAKSQYKLFRMQQLRKINTLARN